MKQSKSLSSFLSSWVPKVISFMIAALIFISIKYLGMADRIVTIPLEVTLPDSGTVVAESLVPYSIDIVISGDDQLIYLIDPDSIKASADFSAVTTAGIARVPVELTYNEEVFADTALVVTASPDIVRILFEEV